MPKQVDVDYKLLFQSVPGLYMILRPDLTICEVSDAYAKATLITRDNVVGRHLFDVFPDNPDDHSADGVSNLRASLMHVLRHKSPHIMPVQKYDVRRPDGVFEQRYWSPGNRPVLNAENEIIYIIHNATDVTHQQKTEAQLKRREQDYQLLVNAVKDYAIFILDARGCVASWNQGAQAIIGYSAEEIVGKPVSVFYSPEDIEKGEPELNLQETLRRGRLKTEGWRVRKNQTRFYANMALTPLYDDFGELYGYAKITRDITDKKQAEDALRQLNDELEERVRERTLLLEETYALARIGGWELDVPTGKIYWSDITRELHETAPDYSPNLASGLSFYREGASRDLVVKKVNEAIESGRSWDEEVQIVTARNNIKWIRIIGEAEFVDGTCRRLYGSFQDIDQRKRAQLEVIDLNAHLEQMVLRRTEELRLINEELESFTYSVSHDLRAPLRIIAGYGSILKEDYGKQLDDEARKIIESMVRNASRMGQLIDDLLHFSRLSRQTIMKTSVDTRLMVEDIIFETGKKPDKKVDWTIHDLPESIADHYTLRQVWINLISNAIKYSSKVEKPAIEIGFDTTLIEPAFFIKDNGSGFDMLYADKLFGVFQRLHKAKDFEGTGVGLAIVDRIIRKHGGKVWGEGEVGKGACFYFTLPKR